MREVAVGYADSYRGGNRTQGGMGASRTDSAETNNEKVGTQLANKGKHGETEETEQLETGGLGTVGESEWLP